MKIVLPKNVTGLPASRGGQVVVKGCFGSVNCQLLTDHCCRRQPGFSLIELMVVIGLFTIMAVAATTSYLSFEAREQVKNAALQLKSDIRLAQNKAQTGDIVKDDAATGCRRDSTHSLAGWYLHVDDVESGADGYTLNGLCLNSASGYLETIIGASTASLPNEITISCIKYLSGDICPPGNVTRTEAFIFFRTLEYKVSFFDQYADPADEGDFFDSTGIMRTTGQLTGAPDKVIFTLSDGVSSYEVHVNSSGDVYETKL